MRFTLYTNMKWKNEKINLIIIKKILWNQCVLFKNGWVNQVNIWLNTWIYSAATARSPGSEKSKMKNILMNVIIQILYMYFNENNLKSNLKKNVFVFLPSLSFIEYVSYPKKKLKGGTARAFLMQISQQEVKLRGLPKLSFMTELT